MFKPFVDVEISLEVIGSKRLKDLVSKQFDYSNCPRMLTMSKNLNLYIELGVTVRSSIQSLINGSDETHDYESLRLSRVR